MLRKWINTFLVASGWLRACSGSIADDISTFSGAWLPFSHQILIFGPFKIAFLGFWASTCRILARGSQSARDLLFPIILHDSSSLGTIPFHQSASKSPFLGNNRPNWVTHISWTSQTQIYSLRYLYLSYPYSTLDVLSLTSTQNAKLKNIY